MELEALRRAAWLAARQPAGALADPRRRPVGWPLEVSRDQVESALQIRDLFPWIPGNAPGVGVLLVRGAKPSRGRVAVVGASQRSAARCRCRHRARPGVANDLTDVRLRRTRCPGAGR